MWKCLVFIVVLLALTAMGSALDIEIDGDLSDRTQFCIGENITFFCSGSGSYLWIVSSLSVSLSTSISPAVASESTFGFTARRLSASRSSLNVIAFDRLNDTTISCVDGANGDILSSAIVGIFGAPSIPDVNIFVENSNTNSSLKLKISQRGFVHLFDFILDMGVVEWSVPSELSQCIAGYEYSFEHSGISGILPANTTMLPLYRFNINTPCNVDTLSIAPIFHVGPEPIRNSSIHGLISTVMAQKQPIIESDTYVLFLLNIAFEPCENSFMEILLKDSSSMVVNSKFMALTSSSIVNFTNLTPSKSYTCTIALILPNMRRVKIQVFDCSTGHSSMTTSSQETTLKMLSQSQNPYIGAMIGIILIATVIIIILLVIIVVQALKMEKLRLKNGSMQHNKNSDAQYDEIKAADRNESKQQKGTEGVTEISMVGCQAYGTVLRGAGTTGHIEEAAGVYEAV